MIGFSLSSSTVTQLRDAFANTTGQPMLKMTREQTLSDIRARGYTRVAMEWFTPYKGGRGKVSRLILIKC